MSMWLKLVKVAPSFVAAVESRPLLLDVLWFGEDAQDDPAPEDLPLLDAVDPTSDLLEERLGFGGIGELDDIVLAEFWTPQGTWLGPAVGIGASRLSYEFTYGLAWFQPVPEVARIAQGLSAEMAAYGAVPDDDDEEWAYAVIGRSVAEFYTGAAKEGKAVIGGLA